MLILSPSPSSAIAAVRPRRTTTVSSTTAPAAAAANAATTVSGRAKSRAAHSRVRSIRVISLLTSRPPVVVCRGDPSVDRILTILDQTSRVPCRVRVDFGWRPASRSRSCPAVRSFALFFLLLVLFVKPRGGSSAQASRYDREGFPEPAMRSRSTLTRAGATACLLHETSHRSASQASARHMLSALRLAALFAIGSPSRPDRR